MSNLTEPYQTLRVLDNFNILTYLHFLYKEMHWTVFWGGLFVDFLLKKRVSSSEEETFFRFSVQMKGVHVWHPGQTYVSPFPSTRPTLPIREVTSKTLLITALM